MGTEHSEKNIFKIGKLPYEDLSKRYTEIEKKLKDDTLDGEEVVKLQQERENIQKQVVMAYVNSSDDAKEAFANQINGVYGQERFDLTRVGKKDSYTDPYNLGEWIRAQSFTKRDVSFDYNIDKSRPFGDFSAPDKLTEEEQSAQYKKEDIAASIKNTEVAASAKEYVSSIINGLSSDKGFIGILKSGSPEAISIIKAILSQALGETLGIEEANLSSYFERISMEKNSGVSAKGDLEPRQRNSGRGQAVLDEKERINILGSDDLAEEEKEKTEIDKTADSSLIKSQIVSVVDIVKEGLISLIDEMEKESVPAVKKQLEDVKKKDTFFIFN